MTCLCQICSDTRPSAKWVREDSEWIWCSVIMLWGFHVFELEQGQFIHLLHAGTCDCQTLNVTHCYHWWRHQLHHKNLPGEIWGSKAGAAGKVVWCTWKWLEPWALWDGIDGHELQDSQQNLGPSKSEAGWPCKEGASRKLDTIAVEVWGSWGMGMDGEPHGLQQVN
jgi:hypothetical protein